MRSAPPAIMPAIMPAMTQAGPRARGALCGHQGEE